MTATPGPWAVFEGGEDRYPGIEAGGNRSIVIWGDEDTNDTSGVRGDTHEEALANAKLIAQAPAMADMLYDQWEAERCEDETCIEHGQLIRILRAAGRLP